MRNQSRRRAVRGAIIPLAVVSAIVAAGGSTAAFAASTDPNPNPLELANAQLSKQAAADGMVLLANQNHSLPLQKNTNVALFGVGAYATVKGGTGSGNVNQRYAINVRTGLENAGFTVTTSPTYWNAMKAAYDTKYPPTTGGSGFGGSVDYSSVEQALTSDSVQPTANTDTAVYVLARNSGEGADRKNAKGDYLLSDTEQNDIALLGQTYKNVVVVLNSGGIVDTSFFNTINKSETDPAGGTPLDSLFLMSQAGEEGGNALAQVLDGDVTPSGHLTDSWAAAYADYPASATFGANDQNTTTEQYSEGVYVGYRYFDSFYKKINPADPASVVNYPFGYGMSYTDFDIKTQSVQADMSQVTVKAKVTNTGKTYSGKEVVQVYFSAPTGVGEDKPYQELAGWAKTDVLAPGQSQEVTISFATSDMASYYEDSASWKLDPGKYRIRVGDSSRNTHVAANVVVPSTVTTEQDSNQLNAQSPTTLLHSDPANFYSYAAEAKEAQTAQTVPLKTTGFSTLNAASPVEQNVTVDASSPYYALDGGKLSSIDAYVDPSQKNWEGTGAPYSPKTGETVKPVTTDPNATLFDVAKGNTTMQQFVAGLSVTQLANIVEGASAFGTTSHAIGAAGYTTSLYEKLGIPGMTLSDGPAGLRLTQQIATTPTQYQYTTAWPIGTLLSQTWNADLIQQVGVATGKEMAEFGVSQWLAPGMNIHRDPLNGRNFEYYSEDPLLSGLTAASMTKGVQSIPGEGVTIKHFAGNEQEANRNAVNDVIDERGSREIELKGFEYAVKSAQPKAVMSSYNRIGGLYSAQNYDLLTDILRGEWGFKGLVMSDWGGSHDPVATLYAGNDLIEPGGSPQTVINSIIKVPPTFDVNGLPVYNKTVSPTRTSYAWQFNGLTPSATGATTVSATVDGTTDLSKTPASGTTTVDAINNQTFAANAKFTSVNDAYTQTVAMLASTALTAAQKAGISITNVQYAADGTTVTAYTVVIKGNYAAAQNMRLGDLQRSAMRVLDSAMQSPQFAELAAHQGVTGITVNPYTAQFTNLTQFVSADNGKVVGQ